MSLKINALRFVAALYFLGTWESTANADEIHNALKIRACTRSLQSFLNHSDGIVETWLAKPESPLSVHRAFKELTTEHQKAFSAVEEVSSLPIPDIKTDADVQNSLSELRKIYITKRKILVKLSDLDRVFILSIDSIENGLSDHEQGLAVLLPQCQEIAQRIEAAKSHVSSWRNELQRLKAYVGVAQAKRHKLLDLAFKTQENKIRDRAKATLNKDLKELDRLIRQVFVASDLQGEFEEWFYAESERIIREIYTYKQYHEPKATLVIIVQRAQEYQAKAKALPPIGPGVNDYLISRTTLAVNEFTRMLNELKQKTWKEFLDQQTEVMRNATGLDTGCQAYVREFFDLSFSASQDEGRGAGKTFARFKRLCQGGV